MQVPNFIKALLQSRKFWLSLIAASVGVFLFARGEISAEQLANLCAALGAVLVAAIALEDAAAKQAGDS